MKSKSEVLAHPASSKGPFLASRQTHLSVSSSGLSVNRRRESSLLLINTLLPGTPWRPRGFHCHGSIPSQGTKIPQATELSKKPRNPANKAHSWEGAGQPRELSVFCDDPDGGMEGGREASGEAGVCMQMADSLHCTAETNIVKKLYSNKKLK